MAGIGLGFGLLLFSWLPIIQKVALLHIHALSYVKIPNSFFCCLGSRGSCLIRGSTRAMKKLPPDKRFFDLFEGLIWLSLHIYLFKLFIMSLGLKLYLSL